MKITYYSPTTGSLHEFSRKVDLSSGKAGWVNLGTFECSSASQKGDIIIEFTGSGKGELVAPVISAQKLRYSLAVINE